MHATIVVNYRSTPRPERPRITIFIGEPMLTNLTDLLTPLFEGQVFESPQDCLEPVRDLLNTFPSNVLDSWAIILVSSLGCHTLKRGGEYVFTPNRQEVTL